MDIIQEIFKHLPSKRKHTASSWISYNCPYCTWNGEDKPDTRSRGGILHTGEGGFVINCFNCKFKTGWAPGSNMGEKLRSYLRACGASPDDIQKIAFEMWRKKGKGIEFDTRREAYFHPKFEEVKLPKGAKPFSELINNPPKEFLPVLNFVHETRGMEMLTAYDYYWTPERKMESKGRWVWHLNERVIIPCYWQDKIVGFVARHIGKSKMRYFEELPQHFLFNNHLLYDDQIKYITVVEGAFDAIALNGVAVLGSTLSPEQISWLKSSGKEIIVVPDLDKSGYELVHTAIEQGWSVSFPDWEPHISDSCDAAKEYGRLFAVRSALEYRENDSFKIELNSKLRLK